MDHRESYTGSIWSENSMEGRVHYSKDKGLAVLIIENVRTTDGGQYRCREDFKYSPTQNNFILLDIISKRILNEGIPIHKTSIFFFFFNFVILRP